MASPRKDIAAAMESAAQAAQAKFKTQRLDELRKLAKDSIVGRRAQAVKALMTAGNEAGNIFKWSGEVQHSTHNFLVYNKIHGPLSGAADVKIHLGTDNWWQMGKEVYKFRHVLWPNTPTCFFFIAFEHNSPENQQLAIESW